jgi:hypothetical protein
MFFDEQTRGVPLPATDKELDRGRRRVVCVAHASNQSTDAQVENLPKPVNSTQCVSTSYVPILITRSLVEIPSLSPLWGVDDEAAVVGRRGHGQRAAAARVVATATTKNTISLRDTSRL